MESGLITPSALIRTGAAKGVTSPRESGGTVSHRKLCCHDIGSYAKAQDLLRQGHTYLDAYGDGQACESLR
jgi:hypothetical protein